MTCLPPEIFCSVCGQFHGRASHVVGKRLAFTSLVAANSDFQVQSEPAVRKRMSAREAMAFTKDRYKETLDYLA